MASAGTVPPPIHPRPPRSAAGPVVLIILGVVFLLGTMGVLHWDMLGHWFARFWPLLLILWGVLKFMEYQSAQKHGTRSSGIGVGGVFLMLFIIGIGLAATQAARFNWGAIRDQLNIDNDGDFPLFGHTYTYEQHAGQDFPAGASLRVLNERGAVNISVAPDNKITVTTHKRVNAEKQETADQWNTGTDPQITVAGNIVTVNANTQGAGDHWVTSDLDITVPRNAALVLSTRRGDVSVLGRGGNVQVSNQKGEVAVSDVTGKVDLTLDHSSARVSQVSGDVEVDGHGNVNDVTIEDVKGAVRLNGEFMESVKLSKIAKGVIFKSPRTEIEIGSLEGDLDLDSGDLQMSNLTGPVRLNTRSKDIRMDGVTGDVRLRNENGAVEVRAVKPGSMQLENRRGNLELYLPEKASFEVVARAKNGEVQTDFRELNISTNDEMSTASGTVGNGGGPHLVLNNDQGTIEIRKRSSLAMTPSEPPKPPGPPHPRTMTPPDDDDIHATEN